MKLHWAFFLVASLALVCGAGEHATLGSYAGEVTASRLQLRAGPSDQYQPVATLKRGALVVVLGKHPNAPEWLIVEVPQGYHAWVYGSFVVVGKDGSGKITTDRLLVRPSAATRYHQLNGRLNKGETVKVVGKRQTTEGLWYKIVVPRRFPLYAHSQFLKNIGPAKLAEPKKGTKPAETDDSPTKNDRHFELLVKAVMLELPKVKSTKAIQPLRRAIMQVDPKRLNSDNRNRRVTLLSRIIRQEHKLAIAELTHREKQINDELERKLAEIEARYKEKLRRLRESRKPKAPRFVATGIVEYSPDLFGRTPSYRLAKGKKMRFFLIAAEFDLKKFVGKRVGVTGLTDPESGTGYRTIMVRRIEILGDK